MLCNVRGFKLKNFSSPERKSGWSRRVKLEIRSCSLQGMSKETRHPCDNVSSPERKPGWSRRVPIESSRLSRASPALPLAIHLGGKAGEARETRSFKIEGGEQVQVRGGGILHLSPTWRSWAWATERSTYLKKTRVHRGHWPKTRGQPMILNTSKYKGPCCIASTLASLDLNIRAGSTFPYRHGFFPYRHGF